MRHIGESLVAAMEMALASGPPEAAQLVAGECVVLAETKDHLNWELLRVVADKASGATAKALAAACDEVEDDEDEHLYHTTGWTRELWMESLGLPAVLPPPEEQKTSRRRSAPPAPRTHATTWPGSELSRCLRIARVSCSRRLPC